MILFPFNDVGSALDSPYAAQILGGASGPKFPLDKRHTSGKSDPFRDN